MLFDQRNPFLTLDSKLATSLVLFAHTAVGNQGVARAHCNGQNFLHGKGEVSGVDPLVRVYITMENHHF